MWRRTKCFSLTEQKSKTPNDTYELFFFFFFLLFVVKKKDSLPFRKKWKFVKWFDSLLGQQQKNSSLSQFHFLFWLNEMKKSAIFFRKWKIRKKENCLMNEDEKKCRQQNFIIVCLIHLTQNMFTLQRKAPFSIQVFQDILNLSSFYFFFYFCSHSFTLLLLLLFVFVYSLFYILSPIFSICICAAKCDDEARETENCIVVVVF